MTNRSDFSIFIVDADSTSLCLSYEATLKHNAVLPLNCSCLAFEKFLSSPQDTLYLHYGKQYLKDCYIEGSVDFIFGNSTALLEHCHIHCKSAGFITAQSRKSSQETTSYVFLRFVFVTSKYFWGNCENERTACFFVK